MKRGKFIVMEGLDGSGKTSQLNLLAAKLQDEGKKVYIFRELSSNSVSQRIEPIILDPKRTANGLCDIYLWLAAKEYAQFALKDALQQYDYVLMDRYMLSFMAMQGYMNQKQVFCSQATEHFIVPDLTIYLKWPTKYLERHLKKTLKTPDYFESRGTQYFEELAVAFNKLTTQKRYGKIHTVCGTLQTKRGERQRSLDQIAKEIFAVVAKNTL